jgi:hypothetical protein
MSWFQENKFVAVFGGVMLVGAGALGYLIMGASDEYAKAKSNYDEKASTLKSLYDKKPNLLPENLKAFQDRQKALKAEIDKFQKDLAALEIKPEAVTAIAFQDRLKEAVARVVAKANEIGLTLPAEKFYLGFEDYQTAPPKDSAAPSLLRQLRGIEIVVNLLLQSKGVELKKVVREPVPEEKPAAPASSPPPKPGSKGRDDEKKLVQRLSFQVHFMAPQQVLQKVLNGVASNNQQFMVVRTFSVLNEKKDAPPKEFAAAAPQPDPAANPPGVAAAAPAPGAVAPPAPAPGGVVKIFGSERVEVVLDVDMLDFAEPEASGKTAGTNLPK